MVSYEGMFIIEAALSEEERGKVLDEIQDEIKKQGGSIEELTVLGDRHFAYLMKGKSEGYYAQINFQTKPEAIDKLRQKYRLSSQIVRMMILKSAS